MTGPCAAVERNEAQLAEGFGEEDEVVARLHDLAEIGGRDREEGRIAASGHQAALIECALLDAVGAAECLEFGATGAALLGIGQPAVGGINDDGGADLVADRQRAGEIPDIGRPERIVLVQPIYKGDAKPFAFLRRDRQRLRPASLERRRPGRDPVALEIRAAVRRTGRLVGRRLRQGGDCRHRSQHCKAGCAPDPFHLSSLFWPAPYAALHYHGSRREPHPGGCNPARCSSARQARACLLLRTGPGRPGCIRLRPSGFGETRFPS